MSALAAETLSVDARASPRSSPPSRPATRWTRTRRRSAAAMPMMPATHPAATRGVAHHGIGVPGIPVAPSARQHVGAPKPTLTAEEINAIAEPGLSAARRRRGGPSAAHPGRRGAQAPPSHARAHGRPRRVLPRGGGRERTQRSPHPRFLAAALRRWVATTAASRRSRSRRSSRSTTAVARHQEHLGYYPTAEEAALAVARLGRALTASATSRRRSSSAEAQIQRAQQAARRRRAHARASRTSRRPPLPPPPRGEAAVECQPRRAQLGSARPSSRVVMPSAAAAWRRWRSRPPAATVGAGQQSMAAMGMMSYGGLPGGMPAAAGSQAALQQYQQAALAASAGYPPPAGAPPPGSMGMVPYQLPPGHPGAGNVDYVQLRRDALQPVADDVGYLCSMIDVPADSAAAALTQSGGDRRARSIAADRPGRRRRDARVPAARAGRCAAVGRRARSRRWRAAAQPCPLPPSPASASSRRRRPPTRRPCSSSAA